MPDFKLIKSKLADVLRVLIALFILFSVLMILLEEFYSFNNKRIDFCLLCHPKDMIQLRDRGVGCITPNCEFEQDIYEELIEKGMR